MVYLPWLGATGYLTTKLGGYNGKDPKILPKKFCSTSLTTFQINLARQIWKKNLVNIESGGIHCSNLSLITISCVWHNISNKLTFELTRDQIYCCFIMKQSHTKSNSWNSLLVDFYTKMRFESHDIISYLMSYVIETQCIISALFSAFQRISYKKLINHARSNKMATISRSSA